MKAEGGLDCISMKLGAEPIYDGCKAHKTRRGGGGGGGKVDRHSLTPNYPVWFLITPELLHYIYQELYVVCKSNTFVHIDF